MIDNLGPNAWRLTCVYGEAQVPERYKTWDTLRDLASTTQSPWVVMGDFNEVLHIREHDGVGQRSQGQIDAFRSVVNDCALVDLGHNGLSWTFEKKGSWRVTHASAAGQILGVFCMGYLVPTSDS